MAVFFPPVDFCAADNGRVRVVLANHTNFRLGRIDKSARWVVVECWFVVFQGDKCLVLC